MASHEAAGRAVDAGYTRVAVFVPGIKGWKDAGKPTAKP
jgi:rhodanese-related sulfurtransferase